MGKPKKGSRAGVGQIPSPRGRLHAQDSHKEDASKQDEPVTDTVMQVLSRRIRAARKKMQKVSIIESLLEQGQNLQEDQDRIYMMKGPLTAVIEELTKLEPLVEAALTNELAELKRKFELDSQQLEAGPSREVESNPTDQEEEEATEEEEEEEEEAENSNSELKSQQQQQQQQEEEDEGQDLDSPKALASSPTPNKTVEFNPGFEPILDVLYFSQLLSKDQFDISSLLSEVPADEEDVQITKEELQMVKDFSKKAFPEDSHIPKEGVDGARDLAKELASKATPEAEKVFEIIEKVKGTSFYTEELKFVTEEHPVVAEVEVVETPVEQNSEKTSPEAEETTSDAISPQPVVTSDPVTPGVFPMPHYSLPVGSESTPLKTPRPFLPFPGMAMTTSPPVGLVMTQPPHIVGLHPYYSVANVPGPFLQPPPPYYTPPGMAPVPPGASLDTLPAKEDPTPETKDPEEGHMTEEAEAKEEAKEVKEEEVGEVVETQPVVEEKELKEAPTRGPGREQNFEHRSPWRGGRGRSRGRGPHQMHGRRPPHRPPFMQPRDQTKARGRSTYDPRPKYRRNG